MIFGIWMFWFGVLCPFVFVNSLKFVEKYAQKPYLQVQTVTGIVQGTRLASDVSRKGYYYAYMGIPFAQPPLGPLRFRAPKAAKKWSGVLDASQEGSGCVEIYLRTLKPSSVGGSEDCLFLNVYTKYNPRKNNKLLPVMAYIYGGAFVEGNTDVTNYGPDLLIDRDVVHVSLNYRLGIFGFLSTGDLASPGNYGLKDQNLALRWIQANIRSFGGDPGSVTLFGQSAGSVSTHFHLLSPKSKGLFHKAILESGSVLCHWGSQKRPRNLAYMVGVANGITNPRSSEELIEKLRQIDLESYRYSMIGPLVTGLGTFPVNGLPFAPTVEPDHADAFITDNYWYETMEKGVFNRVPTIIGLTPNESLFFARVINIIQPLTVAYDIDTTLLTPQGMNISDATLSGRIGHMAREYYMGPGGTFAKAEVEKLIRFTTHDFFTRPIRKTALLMSKYTPIYFYYFSYEGSLGSKGIHEEGQHPTFKGVAHSEELFYFFNKIDNKSENKTDHLVRNRLLELWTNFAKYGNPTPIKEELLDNIIWPSVSPSDYPKINYLEIKDSLVVRNTFNEQLSLDWWEEMFNKYAVHPLRNY